ncbi:10144_t:CDS:2 [Ambispora gerdemannii]|uniref:10144_t:CDS:1 n=1 Tax=Ambispora gerdemannii TaxID=144530 RepID=A0A9N9BAU3_9GLOM|nr:10144_t:CDS:2 [Ambispora gerdemannii]
MTTYFSPTVKLPVIQPTHISEGSYKTIGDLNAYCVGRPKNKKAVIVSHDMMGFNPRSEQLCDIIASQGFYVVMPYFFNDEPYTIERVKREGNIERFLWLSQVAPQAHVNKVIDTIITHLRAEGYKAFGFFGASWGGKCAAFASHNPAFTAAVLVHVPWLTVNDFKDTQCPVAILSPGDLRDLTPIVQDLKSTKPFARKIVHKRFPEAKYGWVGVLSDYSNPIVAELNTEAMRIAVTFFRENIGIRNY